MSSIQSSFGHKYNAKCPIDGCKYQSRIPLQVDSHKLDNKNSVHSTKCPKHNTDLVRVFDKPKKQKSKFERRNDRGK